MMTRTATLCALLCAVACSSKNADSTVDGASAAGSSGGNPGSSSNTPDAGPATTTGASPTLPAPACQADIELLRKEDFDVSEAPLAYKGEFFGIRDVPGPDDSEVLALLNLVTDQIVAVSGQSVAGFPDKEMFFSALDLPRFTVAPDHGNQSEADFPLVFSGALRDPGAPLGLDVLFRSDGAGSLSVVQVGGETLDLGEFSGAVGAFNLMSLGAFGELIFTTTVQGHEGPVLVNQADDGKPLNLVLAAGDRLSTGDESTPRFVGGIDRIWRGPGTSLVLVSIVDDTGLEEGHAYLSVADTTRDIQCLMTDASLECGGILLDSGVQFPFAEFASDGTTVAAIVRVAGEPTLQYKVLGLPQIQTIEVNTEVQGFSFENIKRPRVCDRDNAVYFAARIAKVNVGRWDELMRIDENGSITQVTDFGSLITQPQLEGHVPDTIENFALGYNCDASLATLGPSEPDSAQRYQAYWASYDKGETMEIIDETPGRRPNGNGDLKDVSPARSGIDAAADDNAPVHVGPGGEFFFAARVEGDDGMLVTQYAVARKPPAGCQP